MMEKLGSGGFGQVYLAVELDGAQREVALKCEPASVKRSVLKMEVLQRPRCYQLFLV